MTQAQPANFQQLLDEHAAELSAVIGAGRDSIMKDGALSTKVKTLMMLICEEDGLQ